MTKREKRLEKLRLARADVPFDEIDAALIGEGFRSTPGSTSHRVYTHPDAGAPLTIPAHTRVKPIYAKNAAAAIEAVRAATARRKGKRD